MKFLSKAKLQFEYKDTDNIKWYTLKEDLILYVGKEQIKNNMTVPVSDLIIVPKDLFYTDLASIPKLLHFIYKPNGKYTRASIIHDYLYSDKTKNRFYADYIFLKCMKLDNVPFHTRYLFYFAVSLFGASHKA